jgi:L-iditol 2-dehydrogenase
MDTREHRAWVADLPALSPGPGEVLVGSKVVGLCRSDLELLHGHLDGQLPVLAPIVPGHEWSGVVLAVAPDVAGFSVGDRVVGECVIADNHWFGFSHHGAAAEQFTVPARLLHRFPASMGFAAAALIEPFTIAYNAIVEAGGVQPDDTVVVIGSGMIGLAATAIAHAQGGRVVVVEPSATRGALAERLGASGVAASAGDVGGLLPVTESGAGADLVIEASGSAAGITSTFGLARFGGRIVNIGINTEESISAPLGLIQAKNLRVRGVTGSAGVWPDAIAFLLRHEIDLTPVITASFPLERLADAIDATSAGNVKVQLVIDDD